MSRKTSSVVGGQTGKKDQYNFLRDEARGASWLLAYGTSTLKVQINAGVVYFEEDKVEFAGGYSPVLTEPTASSRIDVISMDSAGTIIVTEGVEADTPTAPNVPAGNMPICEVYNKAGQVEITDEDEEAGEGYIYKDLRKFLRLPGLISRVRAYITDAQTFAAAIVRVYFDTENYDEQNEFDNSKVSGQADATAANKLHDTGAFTEAAAYYVGRIVYNSSDITYAKVTAKDSNDQLTLDADIMADGESYHLFFSRFTATVAGYYQVNARVAFDLVDGKRVSLELYINDSIITQTHTTIGGAGIAVASIADTVYIGAGEHLYVNAFQNSGSNKSIKSGTSQTFLSVHRLS